MLLIKFCYAYLTFQARFIIVFDLTLNQNCVKQYKQLKYNLKHRIEFNSKTISVTFYSFQMHYAKPIIYHHYMIMHFKDFKTNNNE